jgi:hypothetical protein
MQRDTNRGSQEDRLFSESPFDPKLPARVACLPAKGGASSMKVIVMGFALLFSTVAFGQRISDVGEIGRCALWARNAMYGATQYIRGAPREVEFISRTILLDMLRDSGGVGREKLYVLIEAGNTEQERGYLEHSTLFGYDAMAIWKAGNANLQPVRDEWRQHFLAACLSQTAV